jgi:hypothetical protein
MDDQSLSASRATIQDIKFAKESLERDIKDLIHVFTDQYGGDGLTVSVSIECGKLFVDFGRTTAIYKVNVDVKVTI